MKKTDVWEGEDLYIAYGNYVLLIAEGDGSNLLPEDEEEGYVDYFNLEVYRRNEFSFDKMGTIDTIGGGFMMQTELISDNFYGMTAGDVVDSIFEENGDGDSFELYATTTPDYEFCIDGEVSI